MENYSEKNIMLNRLKEIADHFFGGLRPMAVKMGKEQGSFHTYKTRNKIGDKMLKDIEEATGVNSNYISGGYSPIFIDESKLDEEKIKLFKIRKMGGKINEEIGFNIPKVTEMSLEQMKYYLDRIAADFPLLYKIMEYEGVIDEVNKRAVELPVIKQKDINQAQKMINELQIKNAKLTEQN